MKRNTVLIVSFWFFFLNVCFCYSSDIKISGDITTQAITRNLSLGSTYTYTIPPYNIITKDIEKFFITQTRLKVNADLTENVTAVLQFLNERVWGTEVENVGDDSDIHLDLAYLEIKEMIYEPLSLTVGRQPLRFGRGFIIGDVDTDRTTSTTSGLSNLADDLSLRKSFDAARVTLDYDPLVIDLIYAAIQENAPNIDDDVSLFGLNAGYFLNSNSLIELYFFGKDKDNRDANAGNPTQDYDTRVFTVGLRFESEVNNNLTLYAEYAHQIGDHIYNSTRQPWLSQSFISQYINAFAAQAGCEYKFKDTHNSKIGLEYSYASSDKAKTVSEYEDWEPMYEDQRIGEIAQLFWNRGLQYWKISVSTMPREDLAIGLSFYYLELTEPLLTYGTGQVAAGYANGLPISGNVYRFNYNKKVLGWEIDPYITYEHSENLQIGVIAGIFSPGDMFNDRNKETAYSIRTYAKVEF